MRVLSGKKGKMGGDPSGNVKIWVNGDGAVTRYELNMTVTMKEKDISTTTRVELKDVGTTKYEVPEAVLKLFTD